MIGAIIEVRVMEGRMTLAIHRQAERPAPEQTAADRLRETTRRAREARLRLEATLNAPAPPLLH